jgi:hypothetical protein
VDLPVELVVKDGVTSGLSNWLAIYKLRDNNILSANMLGDVKLPREDLRLLLHKSHEK